MEINDEIAQGVYRVGSPAAQGSLDCNPYLVVEGDEGVLIDPGSVFDFAEVRQRVESIIPLSHISLVVVHDQDPDLCTSLPEFYRAGLTAPVAMHWRTATLVRYYGIQNESFIVNEKGWEWSFRSGRKLSFLPAPYCHFAGSIMTWDPLSGTLFSGDLFGAFDRGKGEETGSVSVYDGSDQGYREKMRAFHEHYMPSRDIVAPVMDAVMHLDPARIAPQHGRLVVDKVRKCVLELRDLKCGSYRGGRGPANAEKLEPGTVPVIPVLNAVLSRLSSIFSLADVQRTFANSPFVLKESLPEMEAVRLNAGDEDVVALFIERMVSENGMRWFTLVEPYLFFLLEEYRLPVPAFMRSAAGSALPVAGGGEAPEENVLYDRLTGLHNVNVFRNALSGLLRRDDAESWGILYFSVDNLEEINQMYGRKAGDDALKSLVYILKNSAKENPDWTFFKLDFPYVACIAEKTGGEAVRDLAEQARYAASAADFAAVKLTVSVGILYSEQRKGTPEERDPDHVQRILLARLFRARKSPAGGICDYMKEADTDLYLSRKILLVEPDESYIRFLEPFFTARGYHLITRPDGSGVLDLRDAENPDLIIAEAMAPRLNGFELRERLLTTARGRNIPFILVSRRKDEDFIRRAAQAGILWFLKKPFSKTELFGLVDNLLRRSE